MEHDGIDYSSIIEQSLMRQFWERHWQDGDTGWDIGYPSPALVEYMDQYENKDAAILIPGCGNAYEAEYLIENDFMDITLLDISATAVEKTKEKFSISPNVDVICADFFAHKGEYDLILEQTFFCALDPRKREKYVKHTAELLKEDGKLVGLLFNKEFGNDVPPFGGTEEEYRKLFEPRFNIRKMEEAYNSIKPRQGSELFMILEKK